MAVINATQYPICYFRYMTKQVSEHPELLSLGQDVADTSQLLSYAEKAEANARATAAKLSALRKLLLKAARDDPGLRRADAVGKEEGGYGLGFKLAAAVVAAAAAAAAAGLVLLRK